METKIRRLFPILLAAALGLSAQAQGAATRPNIILVLIDDLGWADISCYGNTAVETPNIDRLAAEGILFEQFHVNSPICSPSRVAFTTGQHPLRWRITSYLDAARANARRDMANWLDPAAPTLARSLQDAGYATGHFGKWHMGGQRDVDVAPPISDYGFDKSLTNFEGMGHKLLPLTLAPGWKQPRKIWEEAENLGGPFAWMPRNEITAGFIDAALAFIKTARAEGKPFYVNLWPDDVHGPWFPSIENWRDDGVPGLYLAVLEEMDRQLGVLFDFIRNDPSLRDNTLVMFCSDNGADPKTFDPSNKPLRGSKATLYEGGLRSPLIAWGPGLVDPSKAGSRNAVSLFSAVDLVPSMLQLAKAGAPAHVHLDGENMLDTLLGRSDGSRGAPLYFCRPPDFKSFGGLENLPDLSIRKGRWKLLCDYDGGRPELYDVLSDPAESINLLASMPEIAKELSVEVVGWYKKTHAGN